MKATHARRTRTSPRRHRVLRRETWNDPKSRNGADGHDFKLLPNGNALAFGAETHEVDSRPLFPGGIARALRWDDTVSEVSPSGMVLWRWSSWGRISESEITDNPKDPLVPEDYEVVHTNSIDPQEDGSLVLSFRNTSTVAKSARREIRRTRTDPLVRQRQLPHSPGEPSRRIRDRRKRQNGQDGVTTPPSGAGIRPDLGLRSETAKRPYPDVLRTPGADQRGRCRFEGRVGGVDAGLRRVSGPKRRHAPSVSTRAPEDAASRHRGATIASVRSDRALRCARSWMSTVHKLIDLTGCMALQWLPKAAIDAHKVRRLRRLLTLCEREVPLYRETFRKAGVTARDLRSLDELKAFPTLTREEVIDAYPDGILSRPPRSEDVVFRTSGTSGRFMQIAYSARANDFLDAVYGRALFVAGYKPWDKIAYYWWEAEPKPLRTYERLGLMRKHLLKVHADPKEQLRDLDALEPDVVYHFPSSMLLVARILEREPGQHRVKPRLVICHGELMTTEQRRYLERVLGCPVFDQYGAQEFNRMGWHCDRHSGFHEDSDSVHIEVLAGERPASPSEEGEIVVTGLANDLMPLVRYRIGDTGSLLPPRCGCGRALPLFRLTEGRLDDVLELPDGRRVGPRTLAPRIEELRGFHQYRVVQRRIDALEVLLVCDAEADAGLELRVQRAITDVVGERVRVEPRRVPEIPLSRRGKLRKIVGMRSSAAGPDAAPGC
jgi:phenylacetate-CoA ligase